MAAKKSAADKILLLFDLNGTLGYVNKNLKTVSQQGIYTGNELIKPVFQDAHQQIYQRPNLKYINHDILLKMKDKFDIGVWSCQSRENTQVQLKYLFGRFFPQKGLQGKDYAESVEEQEIKPVPISRNLGSIFQKYPQYDEQSTIVVSNFYNKMEDFQRNDLVLPMYHPKVGTTDFIDDRHMHFLYQYLKFILSLDTAVGSDIRIRMGYASYEAFIQRLVKQSKIDSYNYGKNTTPEF
ncbi:UNKNOWN [Stylonychia lemnae]|uniref:FCP1 homology domain-containing protein n=1 Tax=Stylonychia lemnae TaxID=5949 RepID=A0A078AS61_STYLE|nr:UNKNOWN [Stylonychia lemnae]|eukprot:CDW85004.1 UNKNOWN [Stylonychia lemnae]